MRQTASQTWKKQCISIQTMMLSRTLQQFVLLVAALLVMGYPSVTSADHDDDNYENDADIVYDFSYEVKDTPTGNDFGHRQNRQGLVTQGQYRVLLPDGRMQIVDYVADPTGFQPSIRYQQIFTPDTHFAGTQDEPQFDTAPSSFDPNARQKRSRKRRSVRKISPRRSH